MHYILFYCKCRKRAKVAYYLVISYIRDIACASHCLIIRHSRLIIRQISDIASLSMN